MLSGWAAAGGRCAQPEKHVPLGGMWQRETHVMLSHCLSSFLLCREPAGPDEEAASAEKLPPPAPHQQLPAMPAQPAAAAPAAGAVPSRSPLTRAPRVCAAPGCGATAGLKRCGGCRAVCYCIVECSRVHWPVHKAECRRLQAETAADEASAASEQR